MKKLCTFILLIVCLPLKAAETGNQGELPLGMYLDSVSESCPFSYKEANDKIEGEFLRARLNPEINETLNIWISIQCLNIMSGERHTGNTVSVSIMYGMVVDDSFMLIPDNLGGMLVASPNASGDQFLLNSVSNFVADAITKFLKEVTK